MSTSLRGTVRKSQRHDTTTSSNPPDHVSVILPQPQAPTRKGILKKRRTVQSHKSQPRNVAAGSGRLSAPKRSMPPERSISFHKSHELVMFEREEERRLTSEGEEDPYHLDILENATQFWLESNTNNFQGAPATPFQFDVYDESEQRILFLHPSFYEYDDDGYSDTSQRRGSERSRPPDQYSVYTSIGNHMCKIRIQGDLCCCPRRKKIVLNTSRSMLGSLVWSNGVMIAKDSYGEKKLKVVTKGIPNYKSSFQFLLCCVKSSSPSAKDPSAEETFGVVYIGKKLEQKYGVVTSIGSIIRDEAVGSSNSDAQGYAFTCTDMILHDAMYARETVDAQRNLYKLFVLATLAFLSTFYPLTETEISANGSENSDPLGPGTQNNSDFQSPASTPDSSRTYKNSLGSSEGEKEVLRPPPPKK